MSEEEQKKHQEERAHAYELVRQKLAEARRVIGEAEALMDEHRFSIEFNLGRDPWHGMEYLPKNMTKEEASPWDGFFWHGINKEHMDGGYWMSSSESGDC